MFGLSDKALLIGGISLFLYFGFFPMMKEALGTSDTLGLEKWFLIVGIILISIGISAKIIKSKLQR